TRPDLRIRDIRQRGISVWLRRRVVTAGREFPRNRAVTLILPQPLPRLGAIGNLLCRVGAYPRRVLLRRGKLWTARLVGSAGPVADLFLHSFYAIPRIGVITQKLRSTRAALLFELLKKVGHGLRIKAGLVGDDGSHRVSLRFVASRI